MGVGLVWLVNACQGAVQFWTPRLREVQKAVGQVVVRRDTCEAGCVRGGRVVRARRQSALRVRERARGSAARARRRAWLARLES